MQVKLSPQRQTWLHFTFPFPLRGLEHRHRGCEPVSTLQMKATHLGRIKQQDNTTFVIVLAIYIFQVFDHIEQTVT